MKRPEIRLKNGEVYNSFTELCAAHKYEYQSFVNFRSTKCSESDTIDDVISKYNEYMKNKQTRKSGHSLKDVVQLKKQIKDQLELEIRTKILNEVADERKEIEETRERIIKDAQSDAYKISFEAQEKSKQTISQAKHKADGLVAKAKDRIKEMELESNNKMKLREQDMQCKLDEREKALNEREEALNKREAELNIRSAELDSKYKQLNIDKVKNDRLTNKLKAVSEIEHTVEDDKQSNKVNTQLSNVIYTSINQMIIDGFNLDILKEFIRHIKEQNETCKVSRSDNNLVNKIILTYNTYQKIKKETRFSKLKDSKETLYTCLYLDCAVCYGDEILNDVKSLLDIEKLSKYKYYKIKHNYKAIDKTFKPGNKRYKYIVTFNSYTTIECTSILEMFSFGFGKIADSCGIEKLMNNIFSIDSIAKCFSLVNYLDSFYSNNIEPIFDHEEYAIRSIQKVNVDYANLLNNIWQVATCSLNNPFKVIVSKIETTGNAVSTKNIPNPSLDLIKLTRKREFDTDINLNKLQLLGSKVTPEGVEISVYKFQNSYRYVIDGLYLTRYEAMALFGYSSDSATHSDDYEKLISILTERKSKGYCGMEYYLENRDTKLLELKASISKYGKEV
ncbi:MAG: hypothetical protein IJ593_04995 [Lachnospiraceae bacterium]|nr:hypothetical protein [Lachnospiraceae bacterium]